MQKLSLFLVYGFIMFSMGFYSSYSKNFIYEKIRTLKSYMIGEKFSRIQNISEHTRVEIKKEIKSKDKVGIYITYGQSNAANHSELGYTPSSQVYEFYDNKLYFYEDPSLGVTGQKRSVWGRLGDNLILENLYDKVVFSNTAVEGKRIEELNKGEFFTYFINRYQQLMTQFGHVDGILFFQGEANNQMLTNANYEEEFIAFLHNLEKNNISAPIYLSLTSYCSNVVDISLLETQRRIVNRFDNVVLGPNTDNLVKDIYRREDRCHFSYKGLDVLATLWPRVPFKTEEINTYKGLDVLATLWLESIINHLKSK